jgi:predicted O-methyltransferase YrrM
MLKKLAHNAIKRIGYRVIRQDDFEHFERQLAEVRHFLDAAHRANATEAIRPAIALTKDDDWRGAPVDLTDLAEFVTSSPAFQEKVLPYFEYYPMHSLMSGHSRAYLYSFIRAARPAAALEIGSHFGGTTEVLARAMAENGSGVVHTIDPFGADRVPSVIARWPQQLRATVKFEAVNSMAYLARAADRGHRFGLVLVDGNHDLEYASFDIEMAARLLTRRGLIIVDNAEQLGPFRATRRFFTSNPDWVWLSAPPLQSSGPFAREPRASLPDTDFIVLQAPADFIVREEPQSWGQRSTAASSIEGFTCQLSAGAQGILHYEAVLRAFGDGNRRVEEYKCTGHIALASEPGDLLHRFDHPPLRSEFAALYDEPRHTFDLALAWVSGNGAPLRLKAPPRPLPDGTQ